MTELNDGYGDRHTLFSDEELMLQEEEEFIVRNARAALLKKFGRGFSAGADEDAIQEARIAAWQSWVKHRNRAYMNIAVTQRLIEVVHRDRPMLGTPKSTAKERDPLRRMNAALDDPDTREALENTLDPSIVLLADTVLDQVVMAYHEGEIIEAINSLPPKYQEYVVLRFWHGLKPAEIAAMQGMTTSGLKSAWNRYIRPALAERLAHLADV